jgi:Domain of unknown function (DUF4157)
MLPEILSPRPGRAVVHRCGGWHGSSATCPCQLERQATSPESLQSVPSAVQQVVATPGVSLDEATSQRMRMRLGHDFAQVRVHSDSAAAHSAREVSAVAYTFGQHVVLDPSRVPASGPGRDQVITHELVHTLQNGRSEAAGSGSGAGADAASARVSSPDSPREREAAEVAEAGGLRSGPADLGGSPRVGGAAAGSGARVHRSPDVSAPAPDVGMGLTFREDGRLEVVVSGPKAPVVGNPAVGMRRNADGTWDIVFGGTKKTVTAREIPDLLRSMAAAKPGTSRTLRLPTCHQLTGLNGRPRSFDEYRVNAILWPETLMLTEPLYDALVGTCRPVKDVVTPETTPPPDAAVPDPAPKGDFPERTLPDGEAFA